MHKFLPALLAGVLLAVPAVADEVTDSINEALSAYEKQDFSAAKQALDYASTLLAWLDDDSEGWSETGAFLDRRLADVMRFERWKAEWRGSDLTRPSLTRFLGRLRYPAR